MSICLIMYAFNKLFAAPTYCDRYMETKKKIDVRIGAMGVIAEWLSRLLAEQGQSSNLSLKLGQEEGDRQIGWELLLPCASARCL